jgi:hypothetical protein
MRRLSAQFTMSGLCAAVAMFIATTLNPVFAASPNPTVTVINTEANPVPVTGTVTGQVTGTIKIDPTGNTVRATQSGPWGVTVNEPVTVEPGTLPLQVTVAGGQLSPPGDQLVTLKSGDRVLPNGTVVDFSIPAGKVLVITDVEWCSGILVTGQGPDHHYGERATLVLKFGTGSTAEVFRSTAIITNDDLAANSEHLTTGIVLSTFNGFHTEILLGRFIPTGLNQVVDLVLRGYLTDAN